MVSCHKATQYVRGENTDGLPHYLVQLTKKHISNFDAQNSMVLLDSYDSLLYFLESQLYIAPLPLHDNNQIHQKLPIPPFDVVLILFTLVSLSDHYLEPPSRQNNPYNMTRMDFNKRAIKILTTFIQILKNFDTNLYSQYDLELLRCQFFIALDLLTQKSRVLSHNTFRFHLSKNEKSSEKEAFLNNPYKSYVTFLDKKGKIFNNPIIHLILNRRDKILNMVLWTLSNSLSENTTLYTDSREVWIPFMNILLDLYDLRQKYFLKNEMVKMRKSLFVQKLMQSPLSQFFSFVNSIENFSLTLIEYIFISCEYRNNSKNDDNWIKPLYYKEDEMVKTFVPRFVISKKYQLQETMKLRKKLLYHCFQLLLTLPPNRTMPLLRMETEEILSSISSILFNFTNLDQFQAFFQVYDLEMELAFMPLVIEKTINELTMDTCKKPFDLVNRIISMTQFIKEWISVIERYMLISIDDTTNQSQYLQLRKVEICLYYLFEYFELVIDVDSIRKSDLLNKIVSKLISYQKKMREFKGRIDIDSIDEITGFDKIIKKYS